MADATSPTTLYRFYATDGTLLYVGIAGNPGRRFEQHAKDKTWWGQVASVRLEHFTTRMKAASAEMVAIRMEKPRYNIVGSKLMGVRVPALPVPAQDSAPYPVGTVWTWQSKKSGLPKTEELALWWELNGSSISDDYWPSQVDAPEMWGMWLYWLEKRDGFDEAMGCPWVTIHWSVFPCCELAPFQERPWLKENFLSFYTWPRHAETGERLNWNRLPVMDLRWTDQDDKGGFIQEVTGWKPAPLQPFVNVRHLASAAYVAGLTTWERVG